jgi:hypothetical protein
MTKYQDPDRDPHQNVMDPEHCTLHTVYMYILPFAHCILSILTDCKV